MSDTNTLESKQNVPREADVSADVKLYVNETASESKLKVNSETTPQTSSNGDLNNENKNQNTQRTESALGNCDQAASAEGLHRRNQECNRDSDSRKLETPPKICLPNGDECNEKPRNRKPDTATGRSLGSGDADRNFHGSEMAQESLDQDTDADTSPLNLQTGSSQRQSAERLENVENHRSVDSDSTSDCRNSADLLDDMRKRIASLEKELAEQRSNYEKRLYDKENEINNRMRRNVHLDGEIKRLQDRIRELEAQLDALNIPKVPQSEETRDEVRDALRENTRYFAQDQLRERLRIATEALEEIAHYYNQTCVPDSYPSMPQIAKDALAKIKQE